MDKVYNWQINRKMDYKYPESRPEKQAAWVFDTNKCIACQTCSIACKNAWTSGKGQEYMWWNNVETKPWGFYPLGWDVRILEKVGPQNWRGNSYAGKTIFESAPYGEEVLGHRILLNYDGQAENVKTSDLVREIARHVLEVAEEVDAK